MNLQITSRRLLQFFVFHLCIELLSVVSLCLYLIHNSPERRTFAKLIMPIQADSRNAS